LQKLTWAAFAGAKRSELKWLPGLGSNQSRILSKPLQNRWVADLSKPTHDCAHKNSASCGKSLIPGVQVAPEPRVVILTLVHAGKGASGEPPTVSHKFSSGGRRATPKRSGRSAQSCIPDDSRRPGTARNPICRRATVSQIARGCQQSQSVGPSTGQSPTGSVDRVCRAP
jgi:hypothetical protein